jgi:hypothetical protein
VVMVWGRVVAVVIRGEGRLWNGSCFKGFGKGVQCPKL